MKKPIVTLFLLYGMVNSASVRTNGDIFEITVNDAPTEKQSTTQFPYIEPISDDEILKQDTSYWHNIGETTLKDILQIEDSPYKVAKNIIVFIGDGMGVSTITSARIYKGQRLGAAGEEYQLTFDKFSNVALVKTYNVDMQVPDSAATATAIFTGVKTRYQNVGVDVNCNKSIFDEIVHESCKVDSIMVWAQEANKHTGIVTTTRITHATPAATYAHANNRYWECDAELPEDAKGKAKDIARQLVENAPGKNYKVILGGGQQQMGHTTNYTKYCTREDGRNLTSIWASNHTGTNYVLASNNEQLNTVTDDTEYLMGIFAPDHMPYELVRDTGPTGTPSLSDMTRKALQVLKKGPNGFVLLVEGGMIDQAHHQNYARLAMEETSEFDNAIALAINETGPDTLILVTADHSHSFTMEGYSKRGNDILGYTEMAGEDDRPFLTLAYANGPGFTYHYTPDNTTNNTFPWRNPTTDENRLTDPYYAHIGGFYSMDDTHGGEDVALFAKGPNANLIRGVFEQNYIAYFISYTGCIGPYVDLNSACNESNDTMSSSGMAITLNILGAIVSLTMVILI